MSNTSDPAPHLGAIRGDGILSSSFTDREKERDLIRDFFSRLVWAGARPTKPVLSFWGVGGIGKTSLLKKIMEELGADMPLLRFLTLDLDNDWWKPTSSVADFFWHLRCQVAEPKSRAGTSPRGIDTPSFDYLYFALWRAQHPGESFNLSDSVLKDVLKTFTEGSNLLAEISERAGKSVPEMKELSDVKVGGTVVGVFQLLDKGLGLLRNRARKALVRKRGFDPQTMSIKEMEAALAALLAADVEQWLVDHSDESLCTVIDGFERVQSTTLARAFKNLWRTGVDRSRILTRRSQAALALFCLAETRTAGTNSTISSGTNALGNNAYAAWRNRMRENLYNLQQRITKPLVTW